MFILKISITVEGPDEYSKFKTYIKRRMEVLSQDVARTLGVEDKDFVLTIKIHTGSGGKWSGLYIPTEKVILIKAYPYRSGYEAPETILKHEIAHYFIHHISGYTELPKWLNEGLAMKVSGDSEWRHSRVLLNAVISGSIIPLSYLSRTFPYNEINLAYAESLSFVEFLMKKGDILKLLKKIKEGRKWQLAFEETFGEKFYQFEKEWTKTLTRRYRMVMIIFSSTTFWFLMAILFVISYFVKKKRAMERLKEMDWYE